MKRNRILSILIVLTLLFIWGNSLLPGGLSGAISDGVMLHMNRVAARLGLGEDVFTFMYDMDGDGVEEPTSHIVRKMAHVTEFAVLSALLWLRLESRGLRRTLTAFTAALGAAAADELLQRLSHRGSAAVDVLIDAAGVALGLALAMLIVGMRSGRAARREGA